MSTKHMLKHSLIPTALAFWAFVLFFASPAPAADVTLAYSNFFPGTHVQSKLAEDWCKEVEKATEGRVAFQYLPGQALTKADQTYDAVVNGIVDLGMGCFGYTRGRFPVLEVVDLPLGYESGVEATKVVNQVAGQVKPAEISDVQVMYLFAHGPGLLHTKDRPVHKLEDIKGLKIRAHGTTSEMVKALGGTPVAMPMPEVYQALSRGVVDGATYPVESNVGWKLGEVSKYCINHKDVAYTTSFFVVMNKDRWNALSGQDKKAIEAINQTFAMRHGQAWDKIDAEGRTFFLAQPGREIIELTPEENARWKAAVAPVLDSYVQKVSAKGFDGKTIMDTTLKALDQAKAGR